MKRALCFAALSLACNGRPQDPKPPRATQPSAPTAKPSELPQSVQKILPDGVGPRTVENLSGLDRLPQLTDRHRELLATNGFFVAPQGLRTAGKPADPGEARATRPARHLFQVYERNDYIRFPSYVTVDLAIDLTHQYFDAVLRRVEQEYLAPRLAVALRGFVHASIAMHKSARSGAAKRATHGAATYWGTALRLLEAPAGGDNPDVAGALAPWENDPEFRDDKPPVKDRPRPTLTKLPGAIERDVYAASQKIVAASGRATFDAWGQTIDTTLAIPRSHYTGTGTLQRFFRAMSFLGLSTFTVNDKDARPAVLAALGMSYGRTTEAAKAFEDVVGISSFIAGQPPTHGLDRVATSVESKDVEALADKTALNKLTEQWAKFPEHPVLQNGPVVQPIGQRVFADTQVMSKLLPIVRELPPTEGDFVTRTMGALGAAAAMGSQRALALTATEQHERVVAAFEEGRKALTGIDDRKDAYHRTLMALGGLLRSDPLYFPRDPFELRMLQTYAGGWAMLRHDTLLYAYQMGAECDEEELPPPHAWVEPVPQVYAGLRKMVTEFKAQLDSAGFKEAKPAEEEDSQFSSVGQKTQAVTEFLTTLERWSNKELRGEAFTADERSEIAVVGGLAEYVVLTLADAFELGDRNADMAVIADVFTWRGQALEVGVAHPELVYAMIPTPEGWTVARGAVLGYREFFVPATDRMTDEQWRAKLKAAASKPGFGPGRPKWLAPISAEAVGVVELAPKAEGQSRCSYDGSVFTL